MQYIKYLEERGGSMCPNPLDCEDCMECKEYRQGLSGLGFNPFTDFGSLAYDLLHLNEPKEGYLSDYALNQLATNGPAYVPLDNSFNTSGGTGWIDKLISYTPYVIIGSIIIYVMAPRIIESTIGAIGKELRY
jgi:hypothetical protein